MARRTRRAIHIAVSDKARRPRDVRQSGQIHRPKAINSTTLLSFSLWISALASKCRMQGWCTILGLKGLRVLAEGRYRGHHRTFAPTTTSLNVVPMRTCPLPPKTFEKSLPLVGRMSRRPELLTTSGGTSTQPNTLWESEPMLAFQTVGASRQK